MLDALAALVWQAILDDGRDSVPSSTLSALIESGDVELALDSLAEAGLVATWSFEEETHATLTPFAAERLGLRISRGRWVPANAPERRTRVSKAGIECADPDRIADRRIAVGPDGPVLSVSASFGIAAYPDSGLGSAEDLVRRADRALYRAKRSGKNRVELYWADDSGTHRAIA